MDEEKRESELNTKSSGFPISGLIRFTIVLLLVGAVSGYGFSHEWFKAVGSVSADEYSDDDDWEDEYDSDDDMLESDEEYDSGHENITHEGTAKVSNEDIGTIIIDGTTIHLPSKFSDISNLIEVDENSREELTGDINGYDRIWIELITDGQKNGITLKISNDVVSRVAVEDAVVSGITVDNYGNTQADVTFYGGIKIGQSKEDFLNAIAELTYVISEYEGYGYYFLNLGDDEEYELAVEVENDKVTDISLDFYDR